MKKRGQLANKAFIVIIVSAIVILAFINAGKSYGKQEVYYKLAVARDLAITIDLAYSLPGDPAALPYRRARRVLQKPRQRRGDSPPRRPRSS